MVNLVEDWEEIEQYAIRASYTTVRAYQAVESKGKMQIRILVGKYGFEKEFGNLNDPLLARILAFCEAARFLSVCKTVPDEQFFK